MAAPRIAAPLVPEAIAACGECGYLLRGLSNQGLCPECGTAFDRQTLYLFGYARGSQASGYNSSNRRLGFSITFSIVAALIYMNATRFNDFAWLAILVPGVAYPLLTLLRRFNLNQPGPIRVRMDAQGCAQDDMSRPTGNQQRLMFVVRNGVMGFVMVIIGSQHRSRGLLWALVIGFVFGAARVALLRWRRRHARRVKSSDGATEFRLVPWTSVDRFALSAEGNGHRRIRARSGSVLDGDFVDAVVSLDDGQVDTLSAFVGQFSPVVGTDAPNGVRCSAESEVRAAA
jgi:hypothetical protein